MLLMPSIYLKFAAGIKSFTTMKHKIELKRLPGTSFPETAHSSTKAGNKNHTRNLQTSCPSFLP